MRLFVALEIPASLRAELASLIEQFRRLSPTAGGKGPRWVRPENLHITLKFIGEAAPEKLEAICGALANVRCEDPVKLQCRGIGFFPNENRPQVFWAGLDASENLSRLAQEVDEALAAVGIARERRPFAAHLTLARFDSPRLDERSREAIAQAASRDFGSFAAREFHLIESKTKSTGAEYTRIASFPFTAEA